jgi:hypothetical protein
MQNGSRNGAGRPAAADEVNDLQFVSIVEYGYLPLSAGNDLTVQFHGNAVRLHTQLCYEGSYGQTVRKLALFAIDVE